MNTEILGVAVSNTSRAEKLAQVMTFLSEPRFHRIATVNPEFLVMAGHDETFKQALLSADLCVADGTGIVLAGLLKGKNVTRFPGADLLHEILTIAERDGHPIFLAIKKDGLSSYQEIRQSLLERYPKLSVAGVEVIMTEPWEHYQLKAISYKLVLCNFGAPAQELFLESLRANPGEIRIAMGVGGSFDFLTGKQKRAPSWLRTLGLEWLWRLILQPRRWRRIWNAVVVFPLKVLIK